MNSPKIINDLNNKNNSSLIKLGSSNLNKNNNKEIELNRNTEEVDNNNQINSNNKNENIKIKISFNDYGLNLLEYKNALIYDKRT